MIKDVIKSLGDAMGFKELDIEKSGFIRLDIEKTGNLYLEEAHPNLIISLSRKIDNPQLPTFIKALSLCHYRDKKPFRVDTGLYEENDFVFTVRLPREDITLPNLEKAIDFVSKLHDTLAQTNS